MPDVMKRSAPKKAEERVAVRARPKFLSEFVRECVHARLPKIDKYAVLVEKTVENGIQQSLETFDYPITDESVTSYADSANYKIDLAGNIARAGTRRNLGDVTKAQELFASADPVDLRAELARINEAAAKSVENQPSTVGETAKEGD